MLSPAVTERLARVARHPAVDDSLERLRRGSIQETIAGLTDPCKALLVAIAASELRRPILWLVDTERRAEELLEPLRFFGRALGGSAASAALLPALDELPGRGVGPHPEILETRATTLSRYVSGQVSVIVAPTAATILSFARPDYYQGLSLSLTSDQDVSLEEVVAHLRRVGYLRTELVEMPGQFCARGGILDVFPPEAERPVRIELLGDTVESLREFDPDTQRSTGPVPRVALPPLSEFSPSWAAVSGNGADSQPGGGGSPSGSPGDSLGSARTLFELRDGTLVIMDEADAIEAAEKEARQRLGDVRVAGEDGGPEAGAQPALVTEEEWRGVLQRCSRLLLERLPLQRDGREPNTLRVQTTTRYHGQVPAFLAEVRGRVASGEMVLIAGTSAGELERLADFCREYEVPYSVGEIEHSSAGSRLAEDATSSSAQAVTLVRAPLPEGFVVPDVHLAFYGTGDLFEALPAAAPHRERSKAAAFSSDFSELKPGDYVVHVDHGIGEFVGLQTLESEGRRTEFMRLRYADDARLYVPLERMDLVQSYRVVEGAKPALDRLGGNAWATRKARVKKSLTDMADKLLELYAERKAEPGFAFSADSPWQREFEDAFEFTETPDQALAIGDIKRDMERAAPMDRLLCGDVGYGKTEVAMRAAFKAVCDSKQVAVLAPDDDPGLPALRDFPAAHGRVSREDRNAQPVSQRRRTKEDHCGSRGREDRYSHRNAPLALERRALQRSRPAGGGRGAALRRGAQGAAQGDEPQRGRPDADGHAHSAHAEYVARRTAGYVRDRDAAQGPLGHPDGGGAVQRGAAAARRHRGDRAWRPGFPGAQSHRVHLLDCRPGQEAGAQGARGGRLTARWASKNSSA